MSLVPSSPMTLISVAGQALHVPLPQPEVPLGAALGSFIPFGDPGDSTPVSVLGVMLSYSV